MDSTLKRLMQFSLLMLLMALGFGMLSSWAFLYSEYFNRLLPFHQLRPMHVSAALFWIISGAAAAVIYFKREVFKTGPGLWYEKAFTYLWMTTVGLIFIMYGFRKFGGREYWEFPPVLSIPLLFAWSLLLLSYFRQWKKMNGKPPLYVWMWSTGILFFLITFIEQNLWHIDWFRQSFLREITVQWKSNGAMVGAWNQMIYGSSLFVMAKLSKDPKIAYNKQAFFFYFLGLTNLMFNWGHHIYNVPTVSWIRHVSYAISMTEWLIFISILQGFKKKMTEQKKYRHLLTYRFLIAAEYWVFLNLVLALFMSIPAVNRYTHGTHITVAHAMGATIGINTMILLAAFSYILRADNLPLKNKRIINAGYIITHVSLLIFWLGLIAAGITKGYRTITLELDSYQDIMKPVLSIFYVVAFAGIALMTGMILIVYHYFIALRNKPCITDRNTTNGTALIIVPVNHKKKAKYMKHVLLVLTGVLLIFNACKKKDTYTPPAARLRIDLQHKVGDADLLFDSLAYHNKAGETYSISKLNYFLSEIIFYKNNSPVFAFDTVIYIDAKTNGYSFLIPDITGFSYDSVSYAIGVPTAYNEHGKLAPTYENIAMEWPEMMGGGYHFIKLEGHWNDNGTEPGYTIHLGTNPYLVKGGYRVSGQIKPDTKNKIVFTMDINEWLETPSVYSFRSDGVYTMGNAALMQKVSENGRDVIKVKH